MANLDRLLKLALARRQALIGKGHTQTFRAFGGAADDLDGVFIDVYGAGAVLIVYQGKSPPSFDPTHAAHITLGRLKSLGVKAVYVKKFAKDRSRLGGELAPELTDPQPAAGEILPEALLVREANWTLEVRLHDGLSTGLFLDQRENRTFLSKWAADRAAVNGRPPAVLNTFAYTCAFSVATAIGAAITTSVDVSARYLEWGKRNFAHNHLDVNQHRFARMDTFEFFAYARRKNPRYDLIILDPPSFAAGSKRKGIRPWSSVADYSRLINESAALLSPKGMIFASTNTHELCRDGRLEREIIKGLGRRPKWIELPEIGEDFAGDRERFAARAFELAGSRH